MHFDLSRRQLLLGSAGFLLTGCEVPRGAPSRRELLESGEDTTGFALEIVTQDRLPTFAAWEALKSDGNGDWPSGAGAPGDQRLASGDQVSLRIWDAEESSLITSPGAQFSDISNVVVSGRGFVTLPYVGEVAVSGLTLDAARETLQAKLTEIAPSAQVQLTVVQGRGNSVAMLGGVATPGTYPLTERNLPLTTMIAAAGGVDSALTFPRVQITRGNNVYRRSLAYILDAPHHDPGLQGGDRVVIEEDPRSFMALGATGRQEVITFDDEKVTALRAISLMGGIDDARADPKGLLVMRRYPESALGRPGGPTNRRVVFAFDLTNADSLFSADEFTVIDGDVVLATQAPATTTRRVLSLFGAILGVGDTAANL